MNQILISDKIYDTPVVRKKRKKYKILFSISIITIMVLVLYYIYGEYIRTKEELVSKKILNEISFGYASDTMIQDDILVVGLDSNGDETQMETSKIQNLSFTETNKYSVYISEGGVQYSVDSVLTIPSIEIKYPVLTETSEDLLKISLNKFWGGEPNTVGNYCIVGHNYSNNGKLFGKLSKIQNGDTVNLQDSTGRILEYKVYNKIIVEPDDVSATSQLTNGKKEITLITCANSGTQRLVVKCREVE